MADPFDTKRDHVRLLFRQQRAMNGVRRMQAKRIGGGIAERGAGRDVFDTMQYVVAVRDMDRVLDELYGVRRGDERALYWRTILAVTRAAYETAVTRMQRFVRGTLLRKGEPELLQALIERGRRGSD